MASSDRKHMLSAIKVAEDCRGEDGRPHPRVGVVVVKAGKVLAKAYRGELGPGEHGEYTALERKLSRRQLAGCTVYTTLEPCTTRNHPKVPCAVRLAERRVARVVIGMLDPNPAICGRGLRRLRDAGITVSLFDSDLMAKVEEQNREFIRCHESLASEESDAPQGGPVTSAAARRDDSAASLELSELVPPEALVAAGMTGFYASRDYYSKYRSHASSIDRYVATAKRSIVIVSVNLMTGLPFDGLCAVLGAKLESRTERITVTISLLDPRKRSLMNAMSPVLNCPAGELARSIRRGLSSLRDFRGQLSVGAQKRFDLRVHGAIPFGSAIMIDHREAYGRIQIETKPYGVPLRQSFAFEVAPWGESGLFNALADGYEALMGNGKPVGEEFG